MSDPRGGRARRAAWRAVVMTLGAVVGCAEPAPPVAPRAVASSAPSAPKPEVEAPADPPDEPTWTEHAVEGFGGRFRVSLSLTGTPTLREPAPPGGAAGSSERASLTLPIGEARPIDCHLRAARLSAVELAQSTAKLVTSQKVETKQVSVDAAGGRLVLRYTQRLSDRETGAGLGTMRVAMAIGEGETLLCSHLGGERGDAFDRTTERLFRQATGLSTATPAYVDIVRVLDPADPELDEHRLRVRTQLPAGKTFETALSLHAQARGGELLVTETTTVLELDASGEVQLATITTVDSASRRIETGLVRLGPNRYGAGIQVDGHEQRSPIVTSAPLRTELSMAPAIRRALDRAGTRGRAELAWSELGGIGRGREVSVIQSRTLRRDARTQEIVITTGDEVLRGCEVDARGALVRCAVERAGAPSPVVRERLHVGPAAMP